MDPPKIKLQIIAKEKAAAMAQYDNGMYAALEDDDDSPLRDNIKASAAKFASLCDNESFPAVFDIPGSLLQSIYISLTQPLSESTPDHSADIFSLVEQHSAISAFVASPGLDQGNATSPHLFVYMCSKMDHRKEANDIASDHQEPTDNSAPT